MSLLVASKAFDICVFLSFLLWDALHLLLGDETKSSLVIFLVRTFGG